MQIQSNPFINLMADSSAEANDAVDRSYMERLVLSAFDSKNVPLTARQVMHIINDYNTGTQYDITSIRPRITELTNRDILMPVDRVMEEGSRKKVTRWMRTER